MDQRIEIDRNQKLNPGDVVDLEYKMIGSITWEYFRATQVALLEYYLNKKNPYWYYRSSQNLSNRMILQFEVREMPADADPQIQQAGITAALISAFVLGTFVFAYLALDKIYLIKQLPEKSSDVVKGTGIGLAGIAVFVLVLYFLGGKVFKIKFKGNPNPEICGYE